MHKHPSKDGSHTDYLTDISAKDKPWDVHKAESRLVSKLYDEIGYEKYSKRVYDCSQSLDFALHASDEGTMKLKLLSTRFCRVRWCPVCLWRRCLMWRARFIKTLPRILADYPRGRFLFLTLTVRNCELDDLRETLAVMNKAWVRVTQRKNFPAIGWVKSIEVTRGRDGSAHPHFHCLLMVNEGYFKRGYLSKDSWIKLWRESLRVDYDPSIDVRTVKNRKKPVDKIVDTHNNDLVNGSVDILVDNNIMSGVLETLKYSVKPDDLISDPDWLEGLTRQMHKARTIGLGGIFKEYLSEDEPEDLIHATEEDKLEAYLSDDVLIFDWGQITKRYAKRQSKSTEK